MSIISAWQLEIEYRFDIFIKIVVCLGNIGDGIISKSLDKEKQYFSWKCLWLFDQERKQIDRHIIIYSNTKISIQVHMNMDPGSVYSRLDTNAIVRMIILVNSDNGDAEFSREFLTISSILYLLSVLLL